MIKKIYSKTLCLIILLYLTILCSWDYLCWLYTYGEKYFIMSNIFSVSMFSDITMVAWNDSPCGVFIPGRSLNTIIRSYLLTTCTYHPQHTPSSLSRDRVCVGSQWIAEAESLGSSTKEEEKENQLVWTWGKVQELYYKRVLQVLK